MTNPSSGSAILPRLSVLLFLQFFVWGAWYLSVSLFMYDHGMGEVRFYAYTAGPLAAILAPFFTGLIADRFFNTERVLGVLFLAAGGFMCLLPTIAGLSGTPLSYQTGAGGVEVVIAEQVRFLGRDWIKGELFNWVIFAHMLCYMPTLGLTASLSFHHLPKGSEQFPLVRLWGTLGWIAAGFALTFGFTETLADGSVLKGEVRDVQFWLGGGCALLLGLYCFFLPWTPAPKRGQPVDVGALLFADAWKQFRKPSFAVFMIGSFLVCIPLAAYYASLQQQMEAMGMSYIAAWKNTGTFLEAGMMFLMPLFFRRLGIKWMIVIGIGAWVLRYVLFALGATPEGFALVIAGIALHGLCYDFFFVTGQVYVDQSTEPEVRGQTQAMNVFFTQGLGLFFGAKVTQSLAGRAFGDVASNSPESLPLWPDLWWPLCGMAAVVLVLFVVCFRHQRTPRAVAT